MKIVTNNTTTQAQLAEVNAKLSAINYGENGQPLCSPEYYTELSARAEELENLIHSTPAPVVKKQVVTVTEKWNNQQSYNCIIVKNSSITIHCTYRNVRNPVPTMVKFTVGMKAEYDSYNTHYLGTITGITDKVITFDCGTRNQPEVRRIKIAEFCSRNWNFDLAKIEKYNAIERQCI